LAPIIDVEYGIRAPSPRTVDAYWGSDTTNSTNMPSIQGPIYFPNIHLWIVQICGIFWIYSDTY